MAGKTQLLLSAHSRHSGRARLAHVVQWRELRICTCTFTYQSCGECVVRARRAQDVLARMHERVYGFVLKHRVSLHLHRLGRVAHMQQHVCTWRSQLFVSIATLTSVMVVVTMTAMVVFLRYACCEKKLKHCRGPMHTLRTMWPSVTAELDS